MKSDNMIMCVQDWVSIGDTCEVAVNVPFPSGHTSPGQGSPSRTEDFCSSMVVAVFGCNFNIALVRVKVKYIRVKRHHVLE